MSVKIKKFRVPYTIEGKGKDASLVLNEAEQEELTAEEVDTTNKSIQTLATEIGADNRKQKEVAVAVNQSEGFIIIKKIAE